MLSKNTAYISRLDHLRFVAAFWVIIYHWHAGDMLQVPGIPILTSVIREGEIGVSLFMVLSGFILAHISLGKTINYRAFIFTRFVRIYPIYILMLVIDAYSGNRSVDFLQFMQLLTPFANLHGASPIKFPQLWTIPVEFQFYLIFPFLMTFVARYGARYLVALIVFALSVRTGLFFLEGYVRDAAYSTILGRIDQFCIGMLLAVIYAKRRHLLSSPIFIPASVVLVYVWVHFFERWTGGGYYGPGAQYSRAWIVSPTIEALVLAFGVMAYLDQRWKIPVAIDRALAFLGATSFSIYAWHWPIYAIYKNHPDFLHSHVWYWTFLFAYLPPVLIVSAASYLLIEKPFLSMRSTYTRKIEITMTEPLNAHATGK